MGVRFSESYAVEVRNCSEKFDTLVKIVAKIVAGEKPNRKEIPKLLRKCQQAMTEHQDLKSVGAASFGISLKKRRIVE